MSVKLLTEHHLAFLSLKGGCTGSSESALVKMPHCWNQVSRLMLPCYIIESKQRGQVTWIAHLFCLKVFKYFGNKLKF